MSFRILTIRLVAVVTLVIATVASASAVEIEQVKSPGGIEAWLIRDRMVPLVSMHFAFRGGAATDPAGKTGRAEMTAQLLTEGAGDLDSQKFAAMLEDRAISLGFDAGLDSIQGSVKTLNEHRDTAFDLLRLALTRPRFDAEAVERVRAQTLAAIARDAENPETLARRTWWATAFPDHPYGRPVRGTVETVTRLQPDDFRDFVRNRLARDNLIIGVVGDITPDELGPLLDRAFGDLPARSAPVDVPEVEFKGDGRTTVVNRTVPQSVMVFGEDGIKRNHPDWFAASIVNYILGGGGFNSRLMTEVREKRGLTYGVYTSLVALDHTGLVLGSSSTANARVAQALDLIRAEWRRMKEQGPTADELADAKSYLTGSFKLQLSSSMSIASMLVAIQYDNLGIDYIDRRDALINAVTIDDVRRVAGQLLDPARMLTVIVGDPAGLAPDESGAGGPAMPPARPAQGG
ncbi:MAG TPA: pitrilysin family protein [Alphaproteobacteria bacterium]